MLVPKVIEESKWKKSDQVHKRPLSQLITQLVQTEPRSARGWQLCPATANQVEIRCVIHNETLVKLVQWLRFGGWFRTFPLGIFPACFDQYFGLDDQPVRWNVIRVSVSIKLIFTWDCTALLTNSSLFNSVVKSEACFYDILWIRRVWRLRKVALPFSSFVVFRKLKGTSRSKSL